MQDLFKQFANQLNSIYQQIQEYHQTKKTEHFQLNQTKTEDEQIQEAENILDRKLSEKQRIDQIITFQNSIEQSLSSMKRELSQITQFIEIDDKNVVEEINSLIETIQKIRQKKVNKEIKNNPKRKKMLQGECEDLNDEMEELKKIYDKGRYQQRKRIEIKENLCELCGMEMKQKLFDSEINKWCLNESEFANKVSGHRNVCIVIEDKQRNVFGGYCSKEIGINKYHFDTNSFLFSLYKNNAITMKKYPVKNTGSDLKILNDASDKLFGFGCEVKNNKNYLSDLCVYKKDCGKKNNCIQSSYEYNNEENALCGNTTFEIERIVVYEMEETYLMKQKRQQQDYEMKINDKERWKNEQEEIEQSLSQLSSKQINKILFDSEKDKWNKQDSSFTTQLQGKQDIIILIEDEQMNLFGGYIGNEIIIGKNVKDNSCFVFSLRKNGVKNLKRFEKNQIGYSYWIRPDSSDLLMGFGMSEDGKLSKDITLFKKNKCSGFCSQLCYDYNDEEFALCGKKNFNIKRIVVYQLN